MWAKVGKPEARVWAGGHGSKLNHQGTEGFSPWFNLPGFQNAKMGLPYF